MESYFGPTTYHRIHFYILSEPFLLRLTPIKIVMLLILLTRLDLRALVFKTIFQSTQINVMLVSVMLMLR